MGVLSHPVRTAERMDIEIKAFFVLLLNLQGEGRGVASTEDVGNLVQS